MRKRFIVFGLVAVCVGSLESAQGQNPFFTNLDFEGVTANNLVPGWTAYIGNAPQMSVLYNSQPLGWGPAVALFGPEWQPVEGNYSVFLLSGYQPPGTWTPTTAAIGQMGTVSFGSLSLRFVAAGDLPAVTLGGQPLDLVSLGPSLYGADVTSFQGQYLELRFTAPADLDFPNQRHFLLDSIVFSPVPVPEPSTWTFLMLGGVLFGIGWRNQRRCP